MSALAIFYAVLNVAVCGFALWKGGAAERLAAGTIFGAIVLYDLAQRLTPPDTHQYFSLAFDAIVAMAFLVLALRYTSRWLGAIMLLYAVQFAMQSFYIVTVRPRDLTQVLINNVDFMGIYACLLMGTIMAWRARMRRARAAKAAQAATT